MKLAHLGKELTQVKMKLVHVEKGDVPTIQTFDYQVRIPAPYHKGMKWLELLEY